MGIKAGPSEVGSFLPQSGKEFHIKVEKYFTVLLQPLRWISEFGLHERNCLKILLKIVNSDCSEKRLSAWSLQ
jgi:hypothetical protein